MISEQNEKNQLKKFLENNFKTNISLTKEDLWEENIKSLKNTKERLINTARDGINTAFSICCGKIMYGIVYARA